MSKYLTLQARSAGTFLLISNYHKKKEKQASLPLFFFLNKNSPKYQTLDILGQILRNCFANLKLSQKEKEVKQEIFPKSAVENLRTQEGRTNTELKYLL
jgi:hypothetical protein